MSDKELRLKARLEGGEETAAGLDKISGAEERVADDTKKSAGATEEATTAQDKLNAAESDYIGILNSIHPALGQMVDAGLKASKVAGDMAGANLSAVGIWQKLTAAIQANAAALKLIGAGGLVVVGIMAIVRATQKMKEEFEAATKAIEDNAKALTLLKQEEAARKQAIEDIAERRMEGGLTAAEAEEAAQRAGRIQGRTPALAGEAINQAVALYAQRTEEQQRDIAYLIQSGKLQVDPSMAQAELDARVDAALGQFAEQAAAYFGREAEQQRASTGAARQQMRGQEGGNLADLMRMLEGMLPPGADVERYAQLAQRYGTVEALEQARQVGLPGGGVKVGIPGSMMAERLTAEEYATLKRILRAGSKGSPVAVSPAEAAEATETKQRLDAKIAASQARIAELEATRYTREQMPTMELGLLLRELTNRLKELKTQRAEVHYHQQHARFVTTDADATRRRTVNGESERERRGVG